MSTLLLVEDDAGVADALRLALTSLGHRVVLAATGEAGLAAMAERPFDVMLLDVMMPGIDGFETARRVRASSLLPIIMLTARSDPVDIVAGLECGADDYVTKPVEPRVLDARIKAVLRRAAPIEGEPVTLFGDLAINRAAMVVARGGEPVALTPTELRLLLELADHAGQVLSRHQLLQRVWGYGYAADSRLVDAVVQRLRAKIEPEPGRPALIRTVRGIGYRLDRPRP
ncbi:MAG: response regulator transcription factor [Propioniciclava sp.]|uniref:response regulator n=1 Tax=Propioniciclava sp. TaxID=2038686 RepID=UPI0039E6E788